MLNGGAGNKHALEVSQYGYEYYEIKKDGKSSRTKINDKTRAAEHYFSVISVSAPLEHPLIYSLVERKLYWLKSE
jgi:hypothetical protein